MRNFLGIVIVLFIGFMMIGIYAPDPPKQIKAESAVKIEQLNIFLETMEAYNK